MPDVISPDGREEKELTVRYDIEKLKRIVSDIEIVMGISLSVVDREKRCLCRGKNADEFCERICSVPEGRMRCECSDASLIEKCAELGAPVSHICHAGILDTAVPIIKDRVIAGYIFIGRVRPFEKPDNIPERLAWLGDSAELIEKRYMKLTYFTSEQLNAVVNLISNIIFDGAIEIIYDDFMEIATSYISKNLDTPLDVATLCEKLYVSKTRLYDAFRTHLGTTVNEYVWGERIKRAKELLTSSGLGTAEVAAAVGLDNPAYFCKIFKERVGVSPSSYRRINTNKK
ncbi:MAG: PocR ligand-binding domain-containing protein [Clostridia bacterium]|nr:PocR ligand-binding domain-containing protein [Clostridia bacterium]